MLINQAHAQELGTAGEAATMDPTVFNLGLILVLFILYLPSKKDRRVCVVSFYHIFSTTTLNHTTRSLHCHCKRDRCKNFAS